MLIIFGSDIDCFVHIAFPVKQQRDQNINHMMILGHKYEFISL